MLIMETIAKIRRRHLVNGESISAIACSLNLSRNNVKKYLMPPMNLATSDYTNINHSWALSSICKRQLWAVLTLIRQVL